MSDFRSHSIFDFILSILKASKSPIQMVLGWILRCSEIASHCAIIARCANILMENFNSIIAIIGHLIAANAALLHSLSHKHREKRKRDTKWKRQTLAYLQSRSGMQRFSFLMKRIKNAKAMKRKKHTNTALINQRWRAVSIYIFDAAHFIFPSNWMLSRYYQ